MVIERFNDQDAEPVYCRLEGEGHMMPDDLTYEGSWVEANCGRCFQLVGCENVASLQQWVANWRDLAGFEVVPVLDGEDTVEAISTVLE
jgi:hypothetical protein